MTSMKARLFPLGQMRRRMRERVDVRVEPEFPAARELAWVEGVEQSCSQRCNATDRVTL